MSGPVAFVLWVLLAYLVIVNGVYLLLHMLAVRTVREKVTLRPLEGLPPVQPALVPPVPVVPPVADPPEPTPFEPAMPAGFESPTSPPAQPRTKKAKPAAARPFAKEARRIMVYSPGWPIVSRSDGNSPSRNSHF